MLRKLNLDWPAIAVMSLVLCLGVFAVLLHLTTLVFDEQGTPALTLNELLPYLAGLAILFYFTPRLRASRFRQHLWISWLACVALSSALFISANARCTAFERNASYLGRSRIPDEFRSPLHKQFIEILKNSDRADYYSINPNCDDFFNSEKMGHVVITTSQVRHFAQLIDWLQQDPFRSTITYCFQPHHLLVLRTPNASYELLLCATCHKSLLRRTDSSGEVTIERMEWDHDPSSEQLLQTLNQPLLSANQPVWQGPTP